MADKVYYEAEGEVLLRLKVKTAFTVRTDDGSVPGRAANLFLVKGKTTCKDGDIEDAEVVSVEILGPFSGTLEDDGLESILSELFENGHLTFEIPKKLPPLKLNVVDAK